VKSACPKSLPVSEDLAGNSERSFILDLTKFCAILGGKQFRTVRIVLAIIVKIQFKFKCHSVRPT